MNEYTNARIKNEADTKMYYSEFLYVFFSLLLLLPPRLDIDY